MSDEVRFSSTGASIAGSISGVALATGVPWVLLNYGQALGGTTLTVLVAFGVVLGGVMGLMSAFFGLVMPSQVRGPSHEGHAGFGDRRLEERKPAAPGSDVRLARPPEQER